MLRERYAGQALPPLVALTANVLKDKKEYLERGHLEDDERAAPAPRPARSRAHLSLVRSA